MSYKQFADKLTAATDEFITPAPFNAMEDGLQAEFEDRMQVQTTAGVVSGFAPTIDGTDVAIAAGEAYADGLRFAGNSTVSFDGEDAADTWYIIIDSSAYATAPYVKTTTKPDDDGADLLLAQVDWDGSTTLSNLEDLRRWGVEVAVIRCFDQATVETGTLYLLVCERDLFIEGVDPVCSDTGSAGSTIVDVHGGTPPTAPVTIYTAQARRPYVGSDAAAYVVGTGGEPNGTRKFSKGDVLTIEVDAAATGAQNLGVAVRVRYC